MEIERKYLIKELPDLEAYSYTDIEQAYISRSPVIRVRRAGSEYWLTVKGRGMMVREELNLPLTAESYLHLLRKAEGTVIRKRRYLIPYGAYTIELDLFKSPREGLYMAEVEFPDEDEARSFTAPDWFGREVTDDPDYHNSNM